MSDLADKEVGNKPVFNWMHEDTSNSSKEVIELQEALKEAMAIGNSRPHQYEHAHFMLTEYIAAYLINRDLTKTEEE